MASAADAGASRHDQRVLVRFRDGASSVAIAAALSRIGATIDTTFTTLGFVRITLIDESDADAAVHELSRDPAVAFAQRDEVVRAAFTPDDTLWSNDPCTGLGQWGWRRIQADRAWDVARGSPEIVVAVIDTGVDRGHPDLAGVVLPGATFTSVASSFCPNNDDDDNSHGTHIAGIIAAKGNDAAGISGVAFGVRILPIKALDCTGTGAASDIAQGIVWATDRGARIVNVSLGTPVENAVLDSAVRYAITHDVLIVAAAGNCGTGGGRCFAANTPEYPAALPGVLAVGATDVNDNVTLFSTRGPEIAVVAPGVRIVSTTPRYPTYQSDRGATPRYSAFTGTSQASAFVSGVAALIWSADPHLGAAEVARRVTAFADDLGEPGRDDEFGSGRVNALRALRRPSLARLLSVTFDTAAPSPFARKVGLDAQEADLSRLLRGPLRVRLVTGELITLSWR